MTKSRVLFSYLTELIVCLGMVKVVVGERVPGEEMAALFALYNGTRGEDWRWRNVQFNGPVWNFTVDAGGSFVDNPCSSGVSGAVWQGVTCSKPSSFCSSQICHITSIDLSSYRLSGSIPPDIGQLSLLNTLVLLSNDLTGEIPSELGQLQALTTLNLDTNPLSGTLPLALGNLTNLMTLIICNSRITGSIPVEVGQLTTLRLLHLFNNELTGTLPPEIGHLTALVLLYLQGNQLTGPIPSEVGGLTMLMRLYLHNNLLTGSLPGDLGHLIALQHCHLYNNLFTGQIPVEVGLLSSLEQLALHKNQLSGTISVEVGQLEALRLLYIYSNQLTGFIPNEVGKLTSLEEFILYSNQLSGTIPFDVGNITSLKECYGYENHLMGPIPTSVGQLSALEQFGFFDNQLTGAIPSEFGNLPALKFLYLQDNMLTSTIPGELGQLLALRQLLLDNNMLSGMIPLELGNLTALLDLFLVSNHLTGPIPGEIGKLNSLEQLVLNSNRLTGSIPSNVGQLAAIEQFHTSENELTGFIPDELGQVTTLEAFNFYNNQLTGSLPSPIYYLPRLQVMQLHVNLLTGSISPEIIYLTELEQLYLFDNQMTGPIPVELGQLTALENLILYNNKLTGSIPHELGQLTAMRLLYLYGNFLTGPIPSQLGQLTDIQQLAIHLNLLTGPIPRAVGQLTAMRILYLDGNQLTGSIPDEIGHLISLEQLAVYNNRITGRIPIDVGKMTSLEQLILEHNMLTGPIPSAMGYLDGVVDVRLNDNVLDGPLPLELSGMRKLGNIFLQNNLLTGILDDKFNHSHQLDLTTIELSNNLLSGSLTTGLFLLPQLSVLSLSVNCFEKELPESICNAESIEVLSLNGLRAAEGCPNRVTVPLSSVALFNTVGGSVPSCVWAMRNLSVLHLTGNGMTGALASSLPPYTQLVDLSLSHNELRGTIPLEYMRIVKLDLSFNQMTGEYTDRRQEVLESSISLEINRLSGPLPVRGLEVTMNDSSLNVLRGNLFSCNDIPSTDEYSDDYVCGSQNLDVALLIFLGAIGIAVVLLVFVLWGRSVVSKKESRGLWFISGVRSMATLLWIFLAYVSNLDLKILHIQRSRVLNKIVSLSDTFIVVMRYAAQLLVVVLSGSFAMYIIKGLDSNEAYATHSHTYSWFWTLAYMRGVVPAGLLIMIWAGAIGACFFRVIIYPSWHKVNDGNAARIPVDPLLKKSTIDSKHGEQHRRRLIMSVSVAYLFNAIVTVTVNALYIYSTQLATGASIQFLLQLSLSFFRVVYSMVAFPVLSRPIRSAVENVRFRFMLLMLNNLLIPCVVTALTSDSCFQGLLVPADEVTTPYTYRTCLLHHTYSSGDSFCKTFGTVDVESAPVVPPFSYSNQCGSVLLTAYVPVFLLGYAIQLMLPLIILVSMTYIPADLVPASVRAMFHGLIWPEYWLRGGESLMHNKAVVDHRPEALLMNRSIMCNDVLNNWLVMVTFGLCSPALALSVVCAVFLKMSLWVALVGRFTRHALLKSTSDDGDCSSAVSTSNHVHISSNQNEPVTKGTITFSRQRGDDEVYFALDALGGVYIPLIQVLAGSFWRLAWCSALFVGVLGWDLAADEVGWLSSLWILLLPVACVLLMRGVACQWCDEKGDSNTLENEEQCKVSCEGRLTSFHVAGGSSTGAAQSPLHVENNML